MRYRKEFIHVTAAAQHHKEHIYDYAPMPVSMQKECRHAHIKKDLFEVKRDARRKGAMLPCCHAAAMLCLLPCCCQLQLPCYGMMSMAEDTSSCCCCHTTLPSFSSTTACLQPKYCHVNGPPPSFQPSLLPSFLPLWKDTEY